MSDPESAASAPPALRLLGPPALAGEGRTVPFSAERPFQLLAYLACRRTFVRRDELAELLYPGRGLEAARSNLRKVLLLARRVHGVGTIEQNGELLRWQPDSDLQRFERACDSGQYADALALYGGPLLQGLDGGWPGEAAEWLAGERSRLEGRWHEAALRRLRELRDDPVAAEALAQALLRHDPLDDEAMQALLEAQGRQGRPGDALQALQGYAQQLSARLGLEPSAALQALGHALRGHTGLAAAHATAQRAAPATAEPPTEAPAERAAGRERGEIVGRRVELAQIAERLLGPEVRLLTLLGQGGIGKTALARAALAQLRPHFAAGAAWVEVEGLESAGQVPPRIALALGLSLDAQQEPWAALAQALGAAASGPRLVVLDNLETLLPAAEAATAAALPRRLAALLQAVPGLRLLATSRIALDLPEEWRLPLDGLPLPDADETDPEVLRANDAVRLFERRALPLAGGFVLEDEAADVVRLVREVEGLPLAICLLASWRRLMPVREIVADLRESLDLLEPGTPQERGVRAAFERSWQQLGPEQQRVLGQLALLPQPVDRPMLRAVLHAPLPVVASLVDRSLVQADGTGRFTLHALIRRQAAPRAADGPALLARHAQYVAQLAHSTRQSNTAQLAALDDDIEHVRAAWRCAMQARDARVLAALVPPLLLNDYERGPRGQALPALREAEALLDALMHDGAAPGEVAAALATVLAATSTLEVRLGRLDAAARDARRAMALADAGMPDRGRLADALINLYSVHWQRGEWAEAEALVPLYQAEALASGDLVRQAFGHMLAGQTQTAAGRHEEALRSYEAARRLLDEAGETTALPALLSNLGGLLRRMRRPHDAVRVLEEGLGWARRAAVSAAQPSLLTNLALAYEELGDVAAMLRTTERALASAREAAEPYALMRALLAHGRALAARDGDLDAALAPVWRALRVAQQLRIGWERHECLISAARVAARCGRHGDAVAVLHWVSGQSGLSPDRLASAQEALAEISAVAGPSADPARGRLDADALVEDVLATLAPEPAADAS